MKKLNRIFERISMLAAMFIVSLFNAVPASAQMKIDNIKTELGNVPDTIKDLINPIINIVLLILGLGVIASLIVAYINKRKDNNSNSNDKIIDALWTAMVVILGIYAVKFLLIGS